MPISPIQIQCSALWVKSLIVFLALKGQMTPGRYADGSFLSPYRSELGTFTYNIEYFGQTPSFLSKNQYQSQSKVSNES